MKKRSLPVNLRCYVEFLVQTVGGTDPGWKEKRRDGETVDVRPETADVLSVPSVGVGDERCREQLRGVHHW